jgi:flagellar secretion chaperone FliS
MAGPRDYARVYRESAVLTASPGQLILMLFDRALRAMASARAAFDRPKTDLRRIEVINRELLLAQSIFVELRGALNHEAGGEFAATMDRLYRYYNRRLREANLRKQVEPVVEVEGLFSVVREAWAEMLRTHSVQERSGELVAR